MKKFIYFALLFAFTSLFGLDYTSFKPDNFTENEYKLSESRWVDTSGMKISGKPNKGDKFRFLRGAIVHVDYDVVANEFVMAEYVEVIAENRKIEVKKSIQISLSDDNLEAPVLKLKKSIFNCKGAFFIKKGSTPSVTSCNRAELNMEDSIMNIGSSLMFMVEARKLKNEKCKGGFDFYLRGSSILTFGMDCYVDPFVMERKKDFEFNLNFVEKGGALPQISVSGKNTNFQFANIKVKLADKPKKGVYPLIVSRNKNADSIKGDFKYYINGKIVELGAFVEVKDVSACIKKLPQVGVVLEIK